MNQPKKTTQGVARPAPPSKIWVPPVSRPVIASPPRFQSSPIQTKSTVQRSAPPVYKPVAAGLLAPPVFRSGSIQSKPSTPPSAPPIYRPATAAPTAPQAFRASSIQPKLLAPDSSMYRRAMAGFPAPPVYRPRPLQAKPQPPGVATPLHRSSLTRPVMPLPASQNPIQARMQGATGSSVQRSSVIQRLSHSEVVQELHLWEYQSVFGDDDNAVNALAEMALMDGEIRNATDYVRLKAWLEEIGLQKRAVPVTSTSVSSVSHSPADPFAGMVPLSKKSSNNRAIGKASGSSFAKKTSGQKSKKKTMDISEFLSSSSSSSDKGVKPPASAKKEAPSPMEEFPALPSTGVPNAAADLSGPVLSLEQDLLRFNYGSLPSQQIVPVDPCAGLSPGAKQLATCIVQDRGSGPSSSRYKNTTQGQNGSLQNYGHNAPYSPEILDEVGYWWTARGGGHEYVPPGPKDYDDAHDVANFLVHGGGASFNWHALKSGPKSVGN
jgi:hypothetical protein